jgi:hypothetical protein
VWIVGDSRELVEGVSNVGIGILGNVVGNEMIYDIYSTFSVFGC